MESTVQKMIGGCEESIDSYKVRGAAMRSLVISLAEQAFGMFLAWARELSHSGLKIGLWGAALAQSPPTLGDASSNQVGPETGPKQPKVNP